MLSSVYNIMNLLIMNIRNLLYVLFTLIAFQYTSISQVSIEGYTFESGNRGYLSQVEIYINDKTNGEFVTSTKSDNDGKFSVEIPPGIKSVSIKAVKDLFHEKVVDLQSTDVRAGKAFVKIELQRAPGYIFEITLAEKSDSAGIPTNHLRDALIEVYNNTTKKSILVLKDHPQPDFKVDLEKGNHYTVMIRKKGYLAKRMEAFVDVEGCILCFEGIGEVRPGVSDNLSGGNTMGTLLANVELERVFEGKSIELPNIYYSYGKANIRKDAAEGLQQAGLFLRDNPEITVELGAHTDSRGKAEKNMDLSARRATAAVEYLVKNEEIEPFRITARGYGESSPAIDCGSDCSEAQFAKNRRTEIKILGVSSKEYKPLEKIKYEENFDEMLAELQSEGQIKVPEDGDIPDDIREKLSTTDTEDIDNSDENSTGKVEKAQSKIVAGEVPATLEDQAGVTEQINNAEMSAIEKAKVDTIGNIKIDEEMSESAAADAQTKVADKAVLIKDNIDAKKANPSVEIMDHDSAQPLKEMNQSVQQAEAVMDEKINNSKILDTKEVGVNVNTATVDGYTGYKIVVAFKRVEIEADDELVADYPDLSVYKAKAGYFLYMTGDFSVKESAEAGLAKIKSDISSAYIVEFDNGNRVN